MLIYNY